MRAVKRVARVRALLAEQGLDAIIVRSVTDLMWLTGFEQVFDTEEAHTGFITADACVLHTDSRYATALRERAAEEGIWHIDDERDGAASFVGRCARVAGLACGTIALEATTPLSLYRALVKELPKVQFAEREDDICTLRAVKDADEIVRLRAAQDIATRAFKHLLETMHAGQTERAVSLELEMEMRRLGADELAFANIVASGPNSANPHSVPSERMLQNGDFVVIDFGARLNGYRSDTTRTVSIGAPSGEQRRIHAAVRAANEEVERTIMPGVTGRQMHELAEKVLADAGFGGKMGHGLGHGVGLDIHEEPVLSPRNEIPLVCGNVVTVEPGIYLAGSNGVRLEDYGVIQEDGFVNFCGLSHDLDIVG